MCSFQVGSYEFPAILYFINLYKLFNRCTLLTTSDMYSRCIFSILYNVLTFTYVISCSTLLIINHYYYDLEILIDKLITYHWED
jgi:hypothetical protein